MNDSDSDDAGGSRLFAIAYCTAAYPICALLLLSRPDRWSRDTLLYEVIIWISVALLLIGGLADGKSAAPRISIFFRVAIIALVLCLFVSSITPAVW